MQRLVNVPDQVEKPGHVDGLFLIVPVLDLVQAPVHGPDGVFLAFGRLMFSRIDAAARKRDGVVDIVPRRMAVASSGPATNPIGPGAGLHKGPLIDREALRLLLGQISVVVWVFLQNGRNRGPLGVVHLQPR
jgi:hypothetical protein